MEHNDKFTTPPWIIGVQYTFYNWPAYTIRDMDDPTSSEEIQSNARLIAAAPLLYRALKELIVFDPYSGPHLTDDEDMIDRAIKALDNVSPTPNY